MMHRPGFGDLKLYLSFINSYNIDSLEVTAQAKTASPGGKGGYIFLLDFEPI